VNSIVAVLETNHLLFGISIALQCVFVCTWQD